VSARDDPSGIRLVKTDGAGWYAADAKIEDIQALLLSVIMI
jgi:hypothetical protein